MMAKTTKKNDTTGDIGFEEKLRAAGN